MKNQFTPEQFYTRHKQFTDFVAAKTEEVGEARAKGSRAISRNESMDYKRHNKIDRMDAEADARNAQHEIDSVIVARDIAGTALRANLEEAAHHFRPENQRAFYDQALADAPREDARVDTV